MIRARKRPLEVEAIEIRPENIHDIFDFGGPNIYIHHPTRNLKMYVKVNTLHGVTEAHEGDFLVRGIKGDFYPVQRDTFLETYDILSQDAE